MTQGMTPLVGLDCAVFRRVSMMQGHKCAILGAAVVSCALPMALGAVCGSVRIGTPFSSIELEQYGGCVDENLPARIAVVRLEDGSYQLEIAEFGAPDGDPEDFVGCFNMRGNLVEAGCRTPAPASIRRLTGDEMRRVDDVVESLEAELYVPTTPIEGAFLLCARHWRINGQDFAVAERGLVLTTSSADRFIELMSSLRD